MNIIRDIVFQIRSRRDSLSVTERKVADAILDDIIWGASATVDQLAAKAGVSIATISRFARTVGCDDTRDLKMKLAQASTVGSRFLDPSAPPEESTFYARIYADIESTLRAHLPVFTEQLFEAAAGIVDGARMIYVFGMGGASAVLAQEVQSRLVRLGYPIAVYSDAVLLRMVAATLDERDAVLILSASGLTPEIVGAARIVKQYRARIVAITDETSALAELADVVLPIRTDETDFIYKPSASRYAMMLAIDLLSTELAMLNQEENRERLRRIKLALDEHRGGPNRLPLAIELEHKRYDTLIGNVLVLDGTGEAAYRASVALADGRIAAIGDLPGAAARHIFDGTRLALAPGFIDVHTHDDTNVIRTPDMLPKLSQGVTTVVVGNCGISASPVALRGEPPDPMNLLGARADFSYPTFADYTRAVEAARPAVNVAALVGHTALRSNHMDRLDRAATREEVLAMREQLRDALAHGAIGLSTGLAYASAFDADTEEVKLLAEALDEFGALYTTHLRSEFAAILDAMQEAFDIARHARVPVVVSHLKCAGAGNWGRTKEVLSTLETAGRLQHVGCDCYPYSASSSTLDLKQVTDEFDIDITWSVPHPEQARRKLADIAADWGLSLLEAAARLQPAGAVYHNMHEDDVRRVLSHRLTMVGSDGLPNDPMPHPRLWGAFPRVLGHYSRDVGLFPLTEAVHKMTGLSASRFGLAERGLVQEGYHADLVLFDPATVIDRATFAAPVQTAAGIEAVWVNGTLSYRQGESTGDRAGRWLPRSGDLRKNFS